MQNNAFDATRPVALQLRAPDGVKTVQVRFPSDDEWAERQRRRRVLIKNLGRGVSETTVPHGEDVDAALLAKIRTDPDGPEVDPFEAQKIGEQLATCEVDDVVLAGDACRVHGCAAPMQVLTERLEGVDSHGTASYATPTPRAS